MTISDIHWGIVPPKEQMKSLEFLFTFLDQMKDIDLLVIAGDYFDSKLPLNSQEAIYAIQWFHRLFDVFLQNGTVIRMIQGTIDHDNDQLEAFRPLENSFNPTFYDDDNFFRIITRTEVEETLEGLHCIYCPDELLTTEEYETTYLDLLLQEHDLAFFHGSFDVIYGSLLESHPEIMKQKNVIYRYDYWNKLVKGPLIAGHWHDGNVYDNLYYCGSPFRWSFGEENDKGFLFLQYDTNTSEYLIEKIKNPLAATYATFQIYSNLYRTKETYQSLLNEIKDKIQELSGSTLQNKIRIQVYLVDEKPENNILISTLRQETNGYPNVKVTVKNRMKEKQRKEESKKLKEKKKQLGFVLEEESKPKIIQRYIQETTSDEVTVPLEYIKEKYQKYVKG